MKRTLAPVATLLISAAILITGQGLNGALLPVRANLEGFPAYAIGLMGAAYYFGFTFGCVKGVTMIRRVGHIRVFAAMTAIVSATPLLHAMLLNETVWIILRMITGFCVAVIYVVIESWLSEKSTNENRGAVFSVYVIIQMTVVAIGQQMLLLADPTDMPLFAIVTVLVSLAAVPMALSTSPIPNEVPEFRFNLQRLYQISPAAILGCMAVGVSSGIFYTLSPLYTASISSNISFTAGFMTAGVLGGALGQLPLGFLSDRIDRRYVIVFAAAGAAIVSLMLWMFSEQFSTTTALALGAVWGAFAFPLYAVSVAHANDYAEPNEFVLISSGLLLVYGVGAVLGPLVGSLLVDIAGAGGMFLMVVGVNLLLCLYLGYRKFRRKPASDENQVPFSEALAAATTKSQVYHYSDEVDSDKRTNSD